MHGTSRGFDAFRSRPRQASRPTTAAGPAGAVIESTSPVRPSRRASLEASAPVFAALGDETRLRLVSAGRGAAVDRAPDGRADVTRQAIAKHLRVLADAGLVRGTRTRQSVWELEPRRLAEAQRALDRSPGSGTRRWSDSRHGGA